MQTGIRIKQERLRQGMKLETLAKDICSASHLSRIENGKVKPRNEVLSKLANRLNISLAAEEPTGPDDHMDLEEQFWRVIHLRNQSGATKLIHTIEGRLGEGPLNWLTKIDLELMVLRLWFVAEEEREDLLEELAVYEKIEQDLAPLQSFRVWQMKGMALYEKGEVQESLKAIAEAEGRMRHLLLEPQERADFSYIYSVILTVNDESFDAIEKIGEALPYFQTIMATIRVAECYVVSGVAYKNIGRPSKALGRFELAEQICRQSRLIYLLKMLHQNIGSVHYVMGNTDQAISYFKRAFEQNEKPLDNMYPILALVKEYERIHEYRQVIHWLAQGQSLLPKLSEKKKEYFETHFRVFEALAGDDDVATERALVHAVSVFTRRGNNSEWREYTKRLGDFYVENRKYKKAVQFFKRILDEEY
ncbi:tetratricopeptide (TPR) repeat protein/DNA-binding XRE family transcriptional regulator [Sporosarcina luteola]|nr:tetratricopeptide (TPR) repeat protein/DNA-binding XRE family transcriptional regulator [Sporosarcina luteola]